jgi:AcrR family transcriptional regulator
MANTSRGSKDLILKTFTDMVAAHGYDEVSLSMVARKLDLSKGTIVHHYTTKDRMLEAIHHEYMIRRTAEIRQIIDELKTPADQLTGFIAQLLLCERDDRAATVAFAREIARFSTLDLMADVRHMRAEYTALLRGVIERGMDEGDFRRDDAEFTTLQIFGMCNWSWTWLRPDRDWPIADIVRTWSTNILIGMGAGGKKRIPDVDRIVDRVSEIMSEQSAAAAAGG